MVNRVRVLVADDHTILAEGLKGLMEKDYDLVGIVADGRALVEAAIRLKPDIVVTDISMPLLNGLDAMRQLKKEGTDARFIFLTMHANPQYATEAFRAGANGYLLKQSAADEFLAAMREVLKGRTYITPLIARELLEDLSKPADKPKSLEPQLTFRQREVLQLVAEGRTAKEIADILHISSRTVESHKYDTMHQLGVKTTAELVQYAVRLGLVAPR
ncbi:MAG TPA: response regulator transcription factor [Pyrinomonadaceae bacterium]